MRWSVTAVTAVLVVGLALAAAPAVAKKDSSKSAGSSTLQVGGFTIGGPGSSLIPFGTTVTILTGLVDEDICATVENTGNGLVRVDLNGGSKSLEIPPGTMATQCGDDMENVELTCLGEIDCTASWRVDEVR